MPKVLVVFGTRPEAIKLLPVIRALKACGGLEVRTCITGQHRDLVDQVLAIAKLAPDIDLNLMIPGQSLDLLTARLLTGLANTLDRERPDRLIVQGDTATAMVGALAGYYRKIPVSHVEAGLRSGDILQPWPEEVNRRTIALIADQHFAPTRAAAASLVRENVNPATIHVTGNTVIDALQLARAGIAAAPELTRGLDPILARFAGKRLVLVTTHRRENFGAGMAGIAEAILRIANRGDTAILFPLHPNPNVAPVMRQLLGHRAEIACIDPLDYPHFVRALDIADVVLTDSGGVQEEAPALGTPVLVMRETTERPEGIEVGTAKLVGTNPHRIASAVETLLDVPAAYSAMANAHNPFGDGRAAERIAGIISESFGLTVENSKSRPQTATQRLRTRIDCQSPLSG